jgi:transcription termination factor NusB
MGKQWIRRFALSLSKEMLGQVRSKFASIPIPGEAVTLNGEALITQAKEEQEKLREELKTLLDELTYNKLAEVDAAIMDNSNKILQQIPGAIYVG